MARGIIGMLVAAAVVLVVVLFIFDNHLLAQRCDHQLRVLTAEKQRASKHIKELQQALAKSAEMLEKMRVGKADASSLHSQLSALTADGGGLKPRRRARQHPRPPPPSPYPPPPSPPPAAEQVPAVTAVQAAGGTSLLTPDRIAVVVIAYNRPRCHTTRTERADPPPHMPSARTPRRGAARRASAPALAAGLTALAAWPQLPGPRTQVDLPPSPRRRSLPGVRLAGE